MLKRYKQALESGTKNKQMSCKCGTKNKMKRNNIKIAYIGCCAVVAGRIVNRNSLVTCTDWKKAEGESQIHLSEI